MRSSALADRRCTTLLAIMSGSSIELVLSPTLAESTRFVK
jgi:hypothetical protein